MKKMIIKVGLMATVLITLAFSCEDTPDTQQGVSKDLVLTPEEREKVSSGNRFAINLLHQAAQGLTSGQNLLISPLSVSSALAMTYFGAKGQTRDEMKSTLQFGDFEDESIKVYYKKLIEDLPLLDPNTKLEIANSIWYRHDVNVLQEFLSTNRDYFHAETHALDFSDPASAGRINTWVSDKTQQLIPTIIDQIPADAVMYLINAIYFKGQWAQQFDEADTQVAPFRKADGSTVQADFMQIEDDFNLWRDETFEAVELPYTDDKYSMVLFRGRAGVQGGKELVDQLKESEALFTSLDQETYPRKTRLKLPKFKFSYENKLKGELNALGMRHPFDDSADFSGMDGAGELKISEVTHKAFIEVNEEGTEAAAVTSVGMVVTSLPQITELTFDSPFVFAIRERSSGLLLFFGVVNDPLVTETKAD